MKIAYFSNCLPQYHKVWGGGEQSCLMLMSLLKKRGYKVDVLITKPEIITNNKNPNFNIHVIRTLEDSLNDKMKYSTRAAKILGIFYDPISFISSYKTLKKIKPDVIHFHKFNHLTFSVLLSAMILKIPTVYTIYDFGLFCPEGNLSDEKNKPCRIFSGPACVKCNFVPTRLKFLERFGILKFLLFFRQKIFKFFLHNFDDYIVLSDAWGDMLKDYGIEEDKIHKVALPLEKIIIKKKIKIIKNSIVFMGQFNKKKGLEVVVKAMPKIVRTVPSVKLYVIGQAITSDDRRYKNRILNFIKKHNIEKNVVFLGKKPHKEALEIIQSVEILTSPEQWENGWSIALTEGMLFGKPTVSSGVEDFVINGENGFLTQDYGNSDWFAEKIIWLLKNKKKAKKMGKLARKEILDMRNRDKVFKDLMSVYKLMIKKSK